MLTGKWIALTQAGSPHYMPHSPFMSPYIGQQGCYAGMQQQQHAYMAHHTDYMQHGYY